MNRDRILLDPPGSPAGTEVVLFVLSPAESRLFFSSHPRLDGGRVREFWIDAEAFSEAAWEEVLRKIRPTVLVTAWSCPPLPLEWAQEEDCPLRYVCSVTGGVRNRIPRLLIERGLLVTNWGSDVSRAVAEHAMLLVLALLRGLPRWGEMLEKQASMFEMMPALRSRTLHGKRVGLHGFGGVARCLAGLLRPYDVEISAFSEGVPAGHFDEFGVHRCGSLRELFARNEILIECEGLNPRSAGSVSAEILALLPPDAVFVNVGRGAVADERALARLAREGRIRVGLDVFQSEPLDLGSPLRDHPGILLSPHVAGPTWETYPLCGAGALQRLEAYLRGETPENRVTLEIYDRAT